MRVTIIGAGAMGAAIGARLHRRGCTVLTLLDGRSAASRQRAADACMVETDLAGVATSDLILSIVPPSQAAAVADELAPLLAAHPHIAFCDANALAPATKRAMAERLSTTGAAFSDGIIIGFPPQADGDGPRLYVCGEGAETVARLGEYGVDVRTMPGAVGEAAALKMCYAALNKGLTALTTAALLASHKAGVADALLAEFGISQNFLLDRARRAVPQMYPKAARWVAEMEEIADFMRDDAVEPASGEIWDAMAHFFDARATAKGSGEEQSIAALLS